MLNTTYVSDDAEDEGEESEKDIESS